MKKLTGLTNLSISGLCCEPKWPDRTRIGKTVMVSFFKFLSTLPSFNIEFDVNVESQFMKIFYESQQESYFNHGHNKYHLSVCFEGGEHAELYRQVNNERMIAIHNKNKGDFKKRKTISINVYFVQADDRIVDTENIRVRALLSAEKYLEFIEEIEIDFGIIPGGGSDAGYYLYGLLSKRHNNLTKLTIKEGTLYSELMSEQTTVIPQSSVQHLKFVHTDIYEGALAVLSSAFPKLESLKFISMCKFYPTRNPYEDDLVLKPQEFYLDLPDCDIETLNLVDIENGWDDETECCFYNGEFRDLLFIVVHSVDQDFKKYYMWVNNVARAVLELGFAWFIRLSQNLDQSLVSIIHIQAKSINRLLCISGDSYTLKINFN